MVCGRNGGKRECMLSPLLCLMAPDWVLKETASNQRPGIRWKLTFVYEDLDYAGDLCLLSTSGVHLSEKAT